MLAPCKSASGCTRSPTVFTDRTHRTTLMDDLASLVVAKLGLRSGAGHYALVACENDPHFDGAASAPTECKIPTIVVRSVTHSTGELHYEVSYINVTSAAHKQLREAGTLPVWTVVTFRRIAVAADFVQGFVRRHKVQYLAYYIDLYEASDVDALFQVDGQGRILAPHEGVKNYGNFHKNYNRVARHPIPDANAMARAMCMLTPQALR